jgi:hypothetical protein
MSTTAYNLNNLLKKEFEVNSIFLMQNKKEVVDPDKIGNCYAISITANNN